MLSFKMYRHARETWHVPGGGATGNAHCFQPCGGSRYLAAEAEAAKRPIPINLSRHSCTATPFAAGHLDEEAKSPSPSLPSSLSLSLSLSFSLSKSRPSPGSSAPFLPQPAKRAGKQSQGVFA